MPDPTLEQLLSQVGAASAPRQIRGGRPSTRSAMYMVRELTEDDLPALAAPAAPQPMSQRKRMNQRHHMLAMTLASGAERMQASAITGYEPETISMLQQDALFMELVEYYRTQQGEKFKDAAEKVASVGLAAVDEIAKRMDDNPDAFGIKDLTDIAEKFLDRTILPSKAGQGRGGPPAAAVLPFKIEFVSAEGGSALRIEGGQEKEGEG